MGKSSYEVKVKSDKVKVSVEVTSVSGEVSRREKIERRGQWYSESGKLIEAK